jgi:plastocyanin
MHRWIVPVFVITIALPTALAGCLGTEDSLEGAPEPDEQNPTPEDPGDSEPAGENLTRRAPTASLQADLLSGTAPLSVNLTLSGDVDPQANLRWELDPGDGSETLSGDTLPTTLTHEYNQVGNFSAVLSVSDGEETVTAELTIRTEEPEATVDPDVVIAVIDDPLPAFNDPATGLPLTVATGTTVQWAWQGSLHHTVTEDTGAFTSGVLGPGSTFTQTLDAPGVYKYHCEVHPMQHGVVIVLPL